MNTILGFGVVIPRSIHLFPLSISELPGSLFSSLAKIKQFKKYLLLAKLFNVEDPKVTLHPLEKPHKFVVLEM